MSRWTGDESGLEANARQRVSSSEPDSTGRIHLGPLTDTESETRSILDRAQQACLMRLQVECGCKKEGMGTGRGRGSHEARQEKERACALEREQASSADMATAEGAGGGDEWSGNQSGKSDAARRVRGEGRRRDRRLREPSEGLELTNTSLPTRPSHQRGVSPIERLIALDHTLKAVVRRHMDADRVEERGGIGPRRGGWPEKEVTVRG